VISYALCVAWATSCNTVVSPPETVGEGAQTVTEAENRCGTGTIEDPCKDTIQGTGTQCIALASGAGEYEQVAVDGYAPTVLALSCDSAACASIADLNYVYVFHQGSTDYQYKSVPVDQAQFLGQKVTGWCP
jgi:hypothetical protein